VFKKLNAEGKLTEGDLKRAIRINTGDSIGPMDDLWKFSIKPTIQ
jgi:hypothetical protein